MITHIDEFEKYLENKGLNRSTIRMYSFHYLKFFTQNQIFDQESVNIYLSHKGNRNPQGRSFLVNLKSFLKLNHRVLNLSPTIHEAILEAEVPKISGRIKATLVNPLTEEEILRLENFFKDERYKIMLLLSFYCGLRIKELYSIKTIHFNFNKWKNDYLTNPNPRCELRIKGKGNKENIVLVPGFLVKRIVQYIKKRGIVLVNSCIFLRNIDKNIKLENAYRDWEIKLKKAGVESGLSSLDEDGKVIPETKVNPHRLRHSLGNHLLNVQKFNLREVQELLRHSSITSTQIYTYVNKENLKKSLEERDQPIITEETQENEPIKEIKPEIKEDIQEEDLNSFQEGFFHIFDLDQTKREY